MDLRIKITDENNEIRADIEIYQDGSDSEGVEKIVAAILDMYDSAEINHW